MAKKLKSVRLEPGLISRLEEYAKKNVRMSWSIALETAVTKGLDELEKKSKKPSN